MAKINHAVAIYRMRYLIDIDAMKRRRKQRDLRRAILAFLNRAERIKREIYGNRNQKDWAFRNIRNHYRETKKVDRFTEILGNILDQKRNLKEGLTRIEIAGRKREQLLRRLIERQQSKENDAIGRLKNHFYTCLKREAGNR